MLLLIQFNSYHDNYLKILYTEMLEMLYSRSMNQLGPNMFICC